MSGTPTRLVRVNDRGYPVGEDHHRSRLTEHDVELILSLVGEGLSYRTIAEKFDITHAYVGHLVSGRKRAQLITTTVRRRIVLPLAIGPADLDEFDIVPGFF